MPPENDIYCSAKCKKARWSSVQNEDNIEDLLQKELREY